MKNNVIYFDFQKKIRVDKEPKLQKRMSQIELEAVSERIDEINYVLNTNDIEGHMDDVELASLESELNSLIQILENSLRASSVS